MLTSGFSRLLLVIGLLLFASCVPFEQNRVQGKKRVEEKKTPEGKKSEPTSVILSKPVTHPEEPGEQWLHTLPDRTENYTTSEAGTTNQDLLDSALDFCQASNDFWEQGDLDNALDALDEAYSLILRVDQGDNADVLQQKEDLRFTISKRIIAVYSSRFTVANGHHKEIPLVMNGHVKRALDLFTGREKAFFLASYQRSGKYRPAIVQALKDAGLPEELSWLPLIESGFKRRALSRARALGLWQFIASTGYKYGLKRGQWIDERMDPEKSTGAAIAYLKELHQIFGDWTTVLAAYNCGEHGVLKRIKSQKISYLDNFWDLYEKLPRETAFYVPKFLAVLHILNDPQAYGMDLPPVEKGVEVELVNTNKQVHLKTVAKSIGVRYELLMDLNAELRHNMTPTSPYSLKVPAGKGEVLLAKLGNIPVYSPPVPPYIVHRVRSGDTLSVIAMRYKSSVGAIMNANGLRRRDYLKVGWKLKVPTQKGYASPQKVTSAYASKPSGESFEYTVRRGDSLWTIADRFHTTTKTIESLNRLRSSTLQVGQVIVIPKGVKSASPGKIKKYTVKEGDSPYLIARRHRMNLAKFLKLNKLTPRSMIFPGQILLVKVD